MPDTQCSSVTSIVVASVHALIGNIESHTPVSVLEAVVKKIDHVVGELAEEFGRVTANRFQLRETYTDLTRRHLALSAEAESAILTARDDLARVAVAEQLEVEARLPVVRETLRRLTKREKELYGCMNTLLGKRLEIEDQLNVCRNKPKCAISAPGLAHALNASEPGGAVYGLCNDKPHEHLPGAIPCSECTEKTMAAKLKSLDLSTHEQKIDERMRILKAGKA